MRSMRLLSCAEVGLGRFFFEQNIMGSPGWHG